MAALVEMFNRYKIACMINDLGYGEMFDYCDETFGRDDFDVKSSMVIGLKRIKERFPGTIYIDDNVYDYINNIVKPYTEQGYEVPYFLLGTYIKTENDLTIFINRVMDYSNQTDLQHDKAINTKDAIEKVEEELVSGRHNFVVMGHSHPIITTDIASLNDRYRILYQRLKEQKEQLDLRGDNLDPTVMDIKSLVMFTEDMKSVSENAIVMGSTYNHNGELNFMFHDGEYGLSLATNIFHRLYDGSLEPIKNFDSNEKEKAR